jgi:tetratricopeptide (TPR) repeat protein
MKTRSLATCLFLICFLCFLPCRLFADDAMDAARKEYVSHFFSVDAHVNLAKQQYDHGERLQAFYTLETARREHFDQKEFTASFRRIFLNDTFDNSPQTEAALLAQIKAAPADAKLLNKLADVYISRKDWKKAIPLLEAASKFQPNEFLPVAAIGRIYTEMGQTAKAESVASTWAQAHPQASESYQLRISELMEKKEDARALAEEALAKYPNDPDLHFDLGTVFEQADNLAATQREFDTAVRLGPANLHIVGWVARFYFMRKIDLRHALDLYLSAYFLEPEFYETEYAEDRIRKLAPEVAQSIMEKPASQQFPPDLTPLRPAAEKIFIRAAEHNWDNDFTAGMLRIMGSHDEVNRATAMTILSEHPSPDAEKQIFQLLNDPDVCKRGMAGYVAVKWNAREAIPVVKTWLADPAELVRFDGLSALTESGPEGLKLLKEYAASGKEQNPRLRELLSRVLSGK